MYLPCFSSFLFTHVCTSKIWVLRARSPEALLRLSPASSTQHHFWRELTPKGVWMRESRQYLTFQSEITLNRFSDHTEDRKLTESLHLGSGFNFLTSDIGFLLTSNPPLSQEKRAALWKVYHHQGYKMLIMVLTLTTCWKGHELFLRDESLTSPPQGTGSRGAGDLKAKMCVSERRACKERGNRATEKGGNHIPPDSGVWAAAQEASPREWAYRVLRGKLARWLALCVNLAKLQ